MSFTFGVLWSRNRDVGAREFVEVVGSFVDPRPYERQLPDEVPTSPSAGAE